MPDEYLSTVPKPVDSQPSFVCIRIDDRRPSPPMRVWARNAARRVARRVERPEQFCDVQHGATTRHFQPVEIRRIAKTTSSDRYWSLVRERTRESGRNPD